MKGNMKHFIIVSGFVSAIRKFKKIKTKGKQK